MNERAKAIVYPLVTLFVLLAVWVVAIRVFKVPNFIVPAPEAVVASLRRGYVDGLFWKHFLFTLQSMVSGYALGCSLAFLLGCAFAESKTVERLFYPYVVALQSMPKVALAPLIIVWFGFELASKVVMVALVCFFPMFINTVVGLRQTNPALLDLMHAFSASRWEILLRIKIPSAAGHVFAGLQIAIVLGLIGAVVAEFVSSTRGLGHLINAAAVNLETDVMFAALISLSVLGVAGSLVIRMLHARIVFWDKGTATRTETAAE
ncbi:MAG: ABC transporter permease [Burkholderiales bacterium]|nr:ABC transporter permease [Burkholderiales bacterium]